MSNKEIQVNDLGDVENDYVEINAEAFQNRDQILVHFQDLTRLEDLDQCLAILESCNWNIDNAVQSYFNTYDSDNNNVNMLNENMNNNELSSNRVIGIEYEFVNEKKSDKKHDIDEVKTAEDSNVPSATVQTNNSSNINQSELFKSLELSKNPNNYLALLNQSRRFIEFHIEYKNKHFDYRLPDNNTIRTIKQLIKQDLNVNDSDQVLKGWPDKDFIAEKNDDMVLKDLNLPLHNKLYLLLKNNNSSPSETDDIVFIEPNNIPSKLLNINKPLTFKVNIRVLSATPHSAKNNLNLDINDIENVLKQSPTQEYKLQFETNQKFTEIKKSILKLANIKENEQMWHVCILNEMNTSSNSIANSKVINLTFLFSNNTFLFEILNQLIANHSLKFKNLSTSSSNNKILPLEELIFFVHKIDLIENKNQSNQNVATTSKNSESEIIQIDDNVEEVIEDDADADDDDVYQLATSIEATNDDMSCLNKKLVKSLISGNVTDELEGTDEFNREFHKRYGASHHVPIFYIGTLDNAIKEALLCPARERKLLALYLHSDNTVFYNIFCSKVLCDETVTTLFNANFILWPWDVTLEQNEQLFLQQSCSKHLGSIVSTSIKSFKDKLPLLIIITRVRANNEILACIQGDTTKEHLIDQLIQAMDLFEVQRARDDQEEQSRDERERIKREQDHAYQASLDYDKAKRQRQEDEMNKEKEKRNEEDKILKNKQEKIENMKLECFNKLSQEPTASDCKNIATIRFKQPSGDLIQRRFFATDKLSSIINFVGSIGFFTEQYKLLSSWPRYDLTTLPQDRTLEELKLYPQETIILEER